MGFSKQKVLIDEKINTEMRNSPAVVAILNPTDDWIYVGNKGAPEEAHENFVEGMNAINIKDFNKVMTAYDLGKLGDSEYLDKIQYGVFNRHDGWQNRAVEYQEKMKKAAVASVGAGVTPADYSGIEQATMTAIIYGLEERTHVLQNALRFVDIEGTRYDYPELTSRINITRNITYGLDIPIKSVGIKTNTKNLLCDAAHFAMFDDVRYRPIIVDVWRTNLEAIGVAFIRDTATQVSEILLDSSISTDAAAGLWSDNTKNPYKDLAVSINTIDTNNGRPNKFATGDLPIANFAGNTNTKTIQMTSQPPSFGAGTSKATLYSGLELWVDNLMNQTKGTLWDDFYVPFVRGPSGVGTYREVPRFLNGNVTFQWKLMFIADLTKIRIITGIS